MEILAYGCISLLILQFSSCHSDRASLWNVLVIASPQDSINDGTNNSWTQGENIYQRAVQAVDDVNRHPTVLQQYELVPIPILVPECDPIKGLDMLFGGLFNSPTDIVAVVGLFCDAVAASFSPVISAPPNKKVLQISGSSLRYPSKSPHSVLHMLPSHADVAGAILDVLLSFNWTRIGIAHAETGHRNHVTSNLWEAAEALVSIVNSQYHNFTVPFKYKLLEIIAFLSKLNSSKVNIVVVFVPLYTANSILMQAAKEDLVWPRLSWIFVHIDPTSVASLPPMWWENVIIISYSSPLSNESNEAVKVISTVESLFSGLVYDSIWRLALALNDTLALELLYNVNGTNMMKKQNINSSNFTFHAIQQFSKQHME